MSEKSSLQLGTPVVCSATLVRQKHDNDRRWVRLPSQDLWAGVVTGRRTLSNGVMSGPRSARPHVFDGWEYDEPTYRATEHFTGYWVATDVASTPVLVHVEDIQVLHPEEHDTETMWRCTDCGKWSHARRKPRRHERPWLESAEGRVPPERVSRVEEYSGGFEGGLEVTTFVTCGPFEKWTTRRAR